MDSIKINSGILLLSILTIFNRRSDNTNGVIKIMPKAVPDHQMNHVEKKAF